MKKVLKNSLLKLKAANKVNSGKSSKCMEHGCQQVATTESFCRLHFLKQVALTSEALRQERLQTQIKRNSDPTVEFQYLDEGFGQDPFKARDVENKLKSSSELDMDWGHFDTNDDMLTRSQLGPGGTAVTSITRIIESEKQHAKAQLQAKRKKAA